MLVLNESERRSYVRQLALATVLEALETREFGQREQVEMEIA
jgi:hypothetical protein